MNILKSSVVLAILLPASVWATTLTCNWDPNNQQDARVGGQFLLQVNAENIPVAVEAGTTVGAMVPQGNNKYIAHFQSGRRNTFWYYPKFKKLKIYDAAIGDLYYDCK